MSQNDRKIYYTLRFAAAMCFIGHGAFGIITKEIWCNYFGVFGIGHRMAYTIMPWVGIVDILMGVSLMVYPTRAIMAWLVIWGIVTAFLRPLSGEPFAEFMERAGNFGAPLALLILCSNGRPLITGPFSLASPGQDVKPETLAQLTKYLRVIVFLLLVGHGWLNLIDKKGLLEQYSSLGFSNPVQVARVAGLFEIAAACMVLIRPLRPLIFILLLWKIGTELMYPQWELFEFIERGGSYGALLALWLALPGVPLRVRNTLVAS